MATRRIYLFYQNIGSETLPNPSSPAEKSANKIVCEVALPQGVKRKRGQYGEYSPETQCKIARFAIENDNTKAVRHFSDILKRDINESTVRSIKSSGLSRR